MLLVGFWFVWFANMKVLFGASDIAVDCDKNIETSSEISLIPFSLYDYCIDLIQRKFDE